MLPSYDQPDSHVRVSFPDGPSPQQTRPAYRFEHQTYHQNRQSDL